MKYFRFIYLVTVPFIVYVGLHVNLLSTLGLVFMSGLFYYVYEDIVNCSKEIRYHKPTRGFLVSHVKGQCNKLIALTFAGLCSYSGWLLTSISVNTSWMLPCSFVLAFHMAHLLALNVDARSWYKSIKSMV